MSRRRRFHLSSESDDDPNDYQPEIIDDDPLGLKRRAQRRPIVTPSIGTASRKMKLVRDPDRTEHWFGEETLPEDVNANSRALKRVVHEYRRWDNDLDKAEYERQVANYKHREALQKQKYDYEESMNAAEAEYNERTKIIDNKYNERTKIIDNKHAERTKLLEAQQADRANRYQLFTNPEYLNYRLEELKEKNRREREIEEAKRKVDEEMRSLAIQACVRDYEKKKERKDVKMVRTSDALDALLADMRMEMKDLNGEGYRTNFCPSRSHLYTGYKKTILFWGVETVMFDTEHVGHLLVYYRSRDYPVRIKYSRYGMETGASIKNIANLSLCIVDICEVPNGDYRASGTLDLNGNLISMDENPLCPCQCRI